MTILFKFKYETDFTSTVSEKESRGDKNRLFPVLP